MILGIDEALPWCGFVLKGVDIQGRNVQIVKLGTEDTGEPPRFLHTTALLTSSDCR